MDVHLSPELDAFAQSAVDSGRFRSLNDVVSAAVELLLKHHEALHPHVDLALEALTGGQGEEGDAYVETPTGELEESQEEERIPLNSPPLTKAPG